MRAFGVEAFEYPSAGDPIKMSVLVCLQRKHLEINSQRYRSLAL